VGDAGVDWGGTTRTGALATDPDRARAEDFVRPTLPGRR